MIDIKLLQKDFNNVTKTLLKKGVDSELLNELKSKSEIAKSPKKRFFL